MATGSPLTRMATETPLIIGARTSPSQHPPAGTAHGPPRRTRPAPILTSVWCRPKSRRGFQDHQVEDRSDWHHRDDSGHRGAPRRLSVRGWIGASCCQFDLSPQRRAEENARDHAYGDVEDDCCEDPESREPKVRLEHHEDPCDGEHDVSGIREPRIERLDPRKDIGGLFGLPPRPREPNEVRHVRPHGDDGSEDMDELQHRVRVHGAPLVLLSAASSGVLARRFRDCHPWPSIPRISRIWGQPEEYRLALKEPG